MDLKSYLLAQLESEAAITRKAVARVPEGRNEFKPHPKSMPLGYLAALVASMPGWITLMIERDELNLDDPSSQGFRPTVPENSASFLELLPPPRHRLAEIAGVALEALHSSLDSAISGGHRDPLLKSPC